MKKRLFDPEQQQLDLSSKIVVGLERISQAFKVLLWDQAKALGLSPIQIQLLIFVTYHRSGQNNVSYLAQEFNVTKPTISDAVKVLDKKGLIIKEYSASDSRSYSIFPSEKGKTIVQETENFAHPVAEQVERLDGKEQAQFFHTLSKLIFQLNRKGVLAVQRTCYSCKFYQQQDSGSYCGLLEKPLADSDIRLDCSEFEGSTT